MRARIWGARGSIPAPGPATARYGGNTSCVELTLADGSTVVLDAGTGIRQLGLQLAHRPPGRVHILLTHLHLDHIQGLMFFAPAFDPASELVIWGPPSGGVPLEDRIARYISAPLSPVEVRELPCSVRFREADPQQWMIGSAVVECAAVTHRGPTLGFRITDGDATLAYIPDHEPGLGTPLDQVDDEWISGLALARGADLLIHDCQYTDAEYRAHLGWGHAPVGDALTFARRAGVRRTLLFHHDPLHDDDTLDALAADAAERWVLAGGEPGAVAMATEHLEVQLGTGEPAGARA